MVLAVATFSAVRSSNRSARVAEESLLAGLRPLLIPSLAGDPEHKALWSDQHVAKVEGGRAIIEQVQGVIYLAPGLRNVGTGIALIHGWYAMEQQAAFSDVPHAPPEQFRREAIDLYVPAGGTGYWESAIRDADDPFRSIVEEALARPGALADRLDVRRSARRAAQCQPLHLDAGTGLLVRAGREALVPRPSGPALSVPERVVARCIGLLPQLRDR